MRTTFDIDADILRAAKALSDAEGKTLGQVLSDLVRRGLAEAAATPGVSGADGLSRGLEASHEASLPVAAAGRSGTKRRKG